MSEVGRGAQRGGSISRPSARSFSVRLFLPSPAFLSCTGLIQLIHLRRCVRHSATGGRRFSPAATASSAAAAVASFGGRRRTSFSVFFYSCLSPVQSAVTFYSLFRVLAALRADPRGWCGRWIRTRTDRPAVSESGSSAAATATTATAVGGCCNSGRWFPSVGRKPDGRNKLWELRQGSWPVFSEWWLAGWISR